MINNRVTSLAIGKQAEDIAALFLTQQGLSLIYRNFWCSMGELDLVMQDQSSLVFIEVKYRKDSAWLAPIEVIDSKKCKKIINASLYFLQQHRQYQEQGCRFDIILITGDLAKQQIKWIKDAFQAEL